MLIGELARRTGVSTRLLRYYEEQRLITSERRSNGYRWYAPEAPGEVTKIRTLLGAGLTTESIREILPCVVLTEDGALALHCAEVRVHLERKYRRLDEELDRIAVERRAVEFLLSSTSTVGARCDQAAIPARRARADERATTPTTINAGTTASQ